MEEGLLDTPDLHERVHLIAHRSREVGQQAGCRRVVDVLAQCLGHRRGCLLAAGIATLQLRGVDKAGSA